MRFFIFKQQTAYEMRISDWSSDVCSSDLSTTIKRSRILVDDRESVLEEAGDVLVPIERGEIDATHILAQLNDLADAPERIRQIRRSADELTLYTTVRSALQDIIVANASYQNRKYDRQESTAGVNPY